MYYNNKGSVLVFVLIVFSIVSTVIMMCIGLNYSNSRINNLNYKNIVMKESLLSVIEIVHSNILKEVNEYLENSETEEEFKNYFLGNTFSNNIKNISNSQIKNITVTIPGKITYSSSGLVTFQIQATFKEDNYTKKYGASVDINTNLNFFNSTDEIDINDGTSNLNYPNYFNDEHDKSLNYKTEDNLENENKINEVLDFTDENIENNKTETNNIDNIKPGSIVKVYDYKEI